MQTTHSILQITTIEIKDFKPTSKFKSFFFGAAIIHAGLFMVVRYVIMFLVIQVSLIIVFQSKDTDEILELIKDFAALIILA